jgi:hypothetical protein
VFTILLAGFKIAEQTAVSMYHGKPFDRSLSDLGGGTWQGILSLAGVLFVVLIPFFGFTELRRVFGDDRLVGVFFHPRSSLNLPPAGA